MIDPGTIRGAMAFAVAGLDGVQPIGVAGMDAVRTSFRSFEAALAALRAS